MAERSSDDLPVDNRFSPSPPASDQSDSPGGVMLTEVPFRSSSPVLDQAARSGNNAPETPSQPSSSESEEKKSSSLVLSGDNPTETHFSSTPSEQSSLPPGQIVSPLSRTPSWVRRGDHLPRWRFNLHVMSTESGSLHPVIQVGPFTDVRGANEAAREAINDQRYLNSFWNSRYERLGHEGEVKMLGVCRDQHVSCYVWKDLSRDDDAESDDGGRGNGITKRTDEWKKRENDS
ncbi:MAG: hypothetical protein Q9181_000330 [Wetmoreana brouardii]